MTTPKIRARVERAVRGFLLLPLRGEIAVLTKPRQAYGYTWATVPRPTKESERPGAYKIHWVTAGVYYVQHHHVPPKGQPQPPVFEVLLSAAGDSCSCGEPGGCVHIRAARRRRGRILEEAGMGLEVSPAGA